MLASTRSRLCLAAAARPSPSRLLPRAYTTTAPRLSEPSENAIPANDPNPRKKVSPVSASNAVPTDAMGARDQPLQESVEQAQRQLAQQAPNRTAIWAKSQQPREKAMTGPRFEQTIMEYQPRPYAAIELIHKQPVRWTKEKVVSCDGGGGPLGHPRVFINTDKPQICVCEYCGLPFANENSRKTLEAQEHTSYPLEPLGHPAEVNESQRITPEGFEQR
ncbi:NADH dehydrogenase (ubiquinone) Fe-S protein 6 [Blastomyces parvus]|uniref:NADH dehydrogenase (Ubiquinone) Fe-S protein 6 n=1 Tax=Blastomyces parvus TaxID=2060905 RepID=A0A2B7XLE8_9EURO|nr:NADH dehydrogenase (ubiquinone) Fe-S protein 6 [Blastomyces parvus]